MGTMTSLVEAVLRATLVLTLAALAAGVCARRGSAALRHLIWSLGLAGALLLPLLWRTLPGVPLPVLPTPAAAPAARFTPGRPAARWTEIRGTSTPPARPAYPEPARQSAAPFGAADALALVWAAGAALALGRLALSLAGLRRLGRAAVVADDPRLMRLAHEATAALGLRRPVSLLVATPDLPVAVPLTYGARRPVVVLPAGASDWPEERLRAALLHELAHVRRGDWLTHVFARVARAVYWFHPFAWLAAHRLRAESEAACDDLVLTAGVPAPRYARHLLDVALDARRPLSAVRTGIEQGAMAMAQTPNVEKRVREVLATGRSRAEVRRGARMMATATAGVALAAVAALRLTAAPVAHAAPHNANMPQAAPGGQREPQFPTDGPTPAGVVRPEEIEFKPLEIDHIPYMPLSLTFRLSPGGETLSVIDPATRQPVWVGPTAQAKFFVETVAAVQTFKEEGTGRTLWTDAEQIGTPDLRLERPQDGRAARLLDKSGALLWTGDLGPSPNRSLSRSRDGRLLMSAGGVVIAGEGGRYAVYADPQGAGEPGGPGTALLWSGALPERASILIRDGRQFSFISPNRGSAGGDEVRRIGFTAETGKVTVTDRAGKELDTRPIDLLRVSIRYDGRPGAAMPEQQVTPRVALARSARGTVYLTYKDASGKIFRRETAYQDGTSAGTHSTG